MIYHRAQPCALCNVDGQGSITSITGFINGSPPGGVEEGQVCLPLAANRLPDSGYWLPDVQVPTVLLVGEGDAPVRSAGLAWTLKMDPTRTKASILAALEAELELLSNEKIRLQSRGQDLASVDVRIAAKKAEIEALKQ